MRKGSRKSPYVEEVQMRREEKVGRKGVGVEEGQWEESVWGIGAGGEGRRTVGRSQWVGEV